MRRPFENDRHSFYSDNGMCEGMKDRNVQAITDDFQTFIGGKDYPCVAARAAAFRRHTPCLVAGHMGDDDDDARILLFIYDFIMQFRKATSSLHSAAVIFTEPESISEPVYERFFWDRLQSLSRLDAGRYWYDSRVSADPASQDFSYSLGEEAFFIIGLHPSNARPARRFKYPAIIFNPHAQFEELRRNSQFDKMKKIVRERDMAMFGSINPMLDDFGTASEAKQYTGRQYGPGWQCPLTITHDRVEHHRTPK